jgi:hypothetical protein
MSSLFSFLRDFLPSWIRIRIQLTRIKAYPFGTGSGSTTLHVSNLSYLVVSKYLHTVTRSRTVLALERIYSKYKLYHCLFWCDSS